MSETVDEIEIGSYLPNGELYFQAVIMGSENGVTILPIGQDGKTVQFITIDSVRKEDNENLVVVVRLTKLKKGKK